jgi:hypothetical protein
VTVQGALGRREPTDWVHVERYPLTAATTPATPRPVVLGINWYKEFDNPTKDSKNRWWIARDGRLTTVRGGHCVCLAPSSLEDTYGWWDFYNQGNEGACVGFGWSRCMSLFNRKRYDAPWLYHEAQKVDEWPGEAYDGTSVRAAGDVLRTLGLRRSQAKTASPTEGIAAFRWATSAQDVLGVLGTPNLDYVRVLNSWGTSYPHYVYMPGSVLERLRTESGEVAVPTDR